jgi:hypothetical protein
MPAEYADMFAAALAGGAVLGALISIFNSWGA